MTTALEGVWGVSVTPRPLFTPGKDTVPIVQESQDRSGQVRKISPPPGFDPRTPQPVASRYTDYATWPLYVHNHAILRWSMWLKLGWVRRVDCTGTQCSGDSKRLFVLQTSCQVLQDGSKNLRFSVFIGKRCSFLSVFLNFLDPEYCGSTLLESLCGAMVV